MLRPTPLVPDWGRRTMSPRSIAEPECPAHRKYRTVALPTAMHMLDDVQDTALRKFWGGSAGPADHVVPSPLIDDHTDRYAE